MKVVFINTHDRQGGAARAAYRLHRGLIAIGQDSTMLVRYKSGMDAAVVEAPRENREKDFSWMDWDIPGNGEDPKDPAAGCQDEAFFLGEVIQKHYIDTHRSQVSNTIFTLPYPGIDIDGLSQVRLADIINLHWVARYQSPVTLQHLFGLGKPVVWTLHDQWPMTGGCHYSAGCAMYASDCGHCHQLADDPFQLPAAILKEKLELFAGANLTIVSPSRWMADCARQSALFKNRRIEVIPNSLETDVFKPMPKEEARQRLGIPAGGTILLFGAFDRAEKRKGFHHLVAAIESCMTEEVFSSRARNGHLKILCFGYPDPGLNKLEIPIISLGYVDSDEKMRQAYAASDLFVLPSLEDNLPNTILEAMSCGTPVVAFDTGGVPDLITDGVTGRMVPAGDVQRLAGAILDLVFAPPEQVKEMGEACRKNAAEKYSLPVQAGCYVELFKELLKASTRNTNKTVPTGHDACDFPLVGEFFPPRLQCRIGPHFQEIYEPVLCRALKEYGPFAQRNWRQSEDDREARLEVIEDLGERLTASEDDREARLEVIEDLGERLTASEDDRQARLKAIEDLGERLAASEEDRQARLEAIEQLGRRLEQSEADRAARLEVIEQMKLEMHHLRRQLPVRVLRKIGIIR